MTLFPGFGGGPKIAEAPPPPPTAADPAVAEAKEKLRLSEKRRKGRSATLLTGEADGLGDANIARPEARAANLLGQ